MLVVVRVVYPAWLTRHQLAPRKLAPRPGGSVRCSNAVMELARGVRAQLEGLLSGLAAPDLTPMSLGLSHSLSRYKLKFSPDKVGVPPRPAPTPATPAPHSPTLLLPCPRPGVGLLAVSSTTAGRDQIGRRRAGHLAGLQQRNPANAVVIPGYTVGR